MGVCEAHLERVKAWIHLRDPISNALTSTYTPLKNDLLENETELLAVPTLQRNEYPVNYPRF